MLRALPPAHGLPAGLLYGGGLRLMEGLALRVKDVDFERRPVIVRDAKGFRDRFTVLPDRLAAMLRVHLEKVKGFASLSHLRSVIDNWREDYNHHRGHSTPGYVPPAEFAARGRQLAGAPSQPTASTTMQTLGLQVEALRSLGAAHFAVREGN